MYTATLIGDTKNIELRRRMVNVEFTNGTVTLTKEFQFTVDAEVNTIKQTVKTYLDELNLEVPALTGSITEVVITPEPAPTQAEKDKAAWHLKWKRLQAYKKLKDHGVNSLTAAQVTTLISEVETGLQAGYGDII